MKLNTFVFSNNERIFGPVLINPPTGEKAEKLWHLVTGWLEFPHLYEMQRPKMPLDLEINLEINILYQQNLMLVVILQVKQE